MAVNEELQDNRLVSILAYSRKAKSHVMCVDGIGSCEVRVITFNLQFAKSHARNGVASARPRKSLPMQVDATASWATFYNMIHAPSIC